ncbi:hypothetical protein DSECCO2_659100 [anaerobic digester metagenome]
MSVCGNGRGADHSAVTAVHSLAADQDILHNFVGKVKIAGLFEVVVGNGSGADESGNVVAAGFGVGQFTVVIEGFHGFQNVAHG